MNDDVDSGNLAKVRRYYDRTESRLGYNYILGGTKHFGWYDGRLSMWSFRRALERMEDELARRLGLPSGAKVLDAGCGTGAVARALASRAGLHVTGMDILDWNLRMARERAAAAGLQDRTEFHLGDYHKLPFPDESFDGVYTMETLVHAADPTAVLKEFHRVLRPGGRLVHFEYAHPPQNAMRASSWIALQDVCRLAAMPAWLEFEDGVLDELVKAAGFTGVTTEDVTRRMMPMVRAFYIMGVFPYFVGRAIGKVEKTVNAMSGVEMFQHQDAWSYNITVATKPEA
ncbi:methyltransferase domain-containing protein [Actinoplanes oblitus]|uniref:Methyltransferase domain-containing protein n=1 Tax=Actinoplanes oblitus TaxID=3040509 RepID=A0ABY8WPX9_9ACTN|nr:methyltransferase domain-containing protein [Actinoplanes oblitus]WIM98930.1 methyltransferase domain-containing protein [Actinoplanes oblitus]